MSLNELCVSFGQCTVAMDLSHTLLNAAKQEACSNACPSRLENPCECSDCGDDDQHDKCWKKAQADGQEKVEGEVD